MYGAEALPLICDQSWFSSRMTKTWPMRLSTETGTASPAFAVPAESVARTAIV